MIGFARKSARVVCALALVVAGVKPAVANIIRVVGPTTVVNDPEGLIKFDVAFDTVNQVYLVVWGTQNVNLHAQFLNKQGQPLGGIFTIRNLSGWARVTYSAQQQKFMVGYSAITFWPPPCPNPQCQQPPMHARYVKFITFNPGDNSPSIGPEIFLDFVGSSPGNSTGVAYSPAYGVFFATWYKYVQVPGGDWSVPRSYVAAIDPNGTLLAINELTNPNLGQSDPNIACGNSGRCLVVGFGWNNAAWGRLIDGPYGSPLGGGPWDIAVTPNDSRGNPVGTLGDATVAYSGLQDKFVVLYVRNFNTIWGKTVGLDGTATDPYVVLQSTPATEGLVGPGYGVPNLAYNAGTSSFLVVGRDYFGRSDAQETDAGGLPLAGSWDQLPPAGESEYVNAVTDPINRRMAMFDNQNFNSIRIALYEIGDPHVLNGNFSDGANNWFGFASPDATGLTTNVTGGVYQLYRTLPVGGSNLAFVYQDTAMSFGAGAHLVAQFDLGNSSSVAKTLNVVLHTNFADQAVCSFTLPANSPLHTYQLRALTHIAWSRASILFDPQTVGINGGYYQIDNVSLHANSGGTNTGTECVEHPSVSRGDTNGDGKRDLLWNHTDGSVALWLMDGLSVTSSGGVLGPASGWVPVQLADLNGDGKSDITWRHPNGSVYVWLMNGTGVTSSSTVLGPGTGWNIKLVGDFNGDGKQDLVWQHTDGSVAIWLMNGLSVIEGGGILGPGSGWVPVQLADLNGDGKSDIVWQHANGTTFVWLMNGLGVTGGGSLLGAGTGWSVRLVGDFNGDNKQDLLWQHTDGRVAVWLMNGLDALGGDGLLGPATAWVPVQLGDFNGDGKSDIVWRHADGSTFVWLMDGATSTGGGSLLGPATGWTVNQLGDFNGDGKTDIVWQHANGTAVMWLMNGLTPLTSGTMLPAGTGWTAVP